MYKEKLLYISNVLKEILYFIFIIYFFYNIYLYIRTTSFLYLYKNGWAFSESLTNYSGGFVRRGLLGEILSLIVKSPDNLVTISFLFYLVSLLHIISFILLKTKDFPLSTQLLIFASPFGLIYLTENLLFVFGRRDQLILNLVIYLSVKKNSTNKNLFIFFFSSIFISLNYELFIIFLPIFWFLLKTESYKLKVRKSIIFCILFITNLLLSTVYFAPSNFNKLCDDIRLNRIALNLIENNGCWGFPNYLTDKTSFTNVIINEIFKGITRNNGIIFWVLIFLIVILFLYIFINFDKTNFANLSPLFLIFFISQDYGRWLILIFLTTLLLTENPKKINSKFRILIILIILISGIILNIPIYLFQEIEFFRFI